VGTELRLFPALSDSQRRIVCIVSVSAVPDGKIASLKHSRARAV
jgi:hypothetical protein